MNESSMATAFVDKNSLEIPLFSVSELSEIVKTSIENLLPAVKVVGEISNFSHHVPSGHFYFSLKDSGALIKVVCFKNQAEKIAFKMEDGMKVVVKGRLSAFVKSSNYQITALECEKTGMGELAKLFHELKAKLEKEGLFDEKYKKPLPFLPAKIGLITAEGGAVLHDILKTLEARFPSKIVLFKSVMQGVNTAKSVSSGIEFFNKKKNVDVIIVARGGGSFEDLFEFNNEFLVRTAFASKIPIISAIGHETDFTLLDFVADKRAPTPTASVFLAVPSRHELMASLKAKKGFLLQVALGVIARKNQGLNTYKMAILGAKMVIASKFDGLKRAIFLIKKHSLHFVLKNEEILTKKMFEITLFDVDEILKKGFAIVSKNDRKISSVRGLKRGDVVKIAFEDGSFEAVVKEETLI
jgi:exodeoxyribonuclease VII large subunit